MYSQDSGKRWIEKKSRGSAWRGVQVLLQLSTASAQVRVGQSSSRMAQPGS